ncbi:aspartate--tRNA ligase [Filifactor alocis ATCC 35896]|uniref:Aspartate--tRNA ligase n=2 Tax=Filifactor TaxID=44259 RepID=D6GSA9_FILAD|nr:aspartate--tRNA ligase [Filifactor alocis]EFE28550.2 aspartate--tRNA ligase [Filifactor alocis ATCC 35896]
MDNICGLKRTNYCNDLTMSFVEKEVVLMGWVQRARDLGGLIFLDLRDRTGIVQVAFDINDSAENFSKAKELGSEYVIAIRGVVKERSSKNNNIATGDIEVFAKELRILNTAKTPPIYIKDDDIVSEDLRLKYRYLDLRKPKMQYNFLMRHKVTQSVRNFLSKEGFLEIETPILTKPTPEGARDYLVPSRVNKGHFYALPQSPQLFKQLLMTSGMDRYFQIAKCFRDEDLRADRQPEFTQIDCEMSFVEIDDVLDVTERLMKTVFHEVLNMEIQTPFKRMKWQEAMDRYGSDKPDIRFGFEINDVSDIVKDCGFKVFDEAVLSGGTVRAINLNGYEAEFSRKSIDALGETAKTYGAKGLAWMRVTESGINSPIAKFLSEDVLNSIVEKMGAKKGDLLLFVADKTMTALTSLGHIRLEAAKKLGVIDENEFAFLYVVEFPLYEYNEEENRYVAAHHPFTAPIDEDLKLFNSSPENMHAKAYDIVLNGIELGGGSIRIHTKDVQDKMFEALGFTKEEAEEKFGFLLNAFQYGTPPHGGIAFGLDRLLMLMLKRDNIREVIAFPKNQNAICPMTEAPAIADKNALQELGIELSARK